MKKNQLADLRNKTIGFIFQFHYLLPEFTALENVLMPFMIGNSKPSKEIKERANELLDLVGLSKVKNNMSTNMSGGQQQRTAIARALINNPKIVLADEPTGNLDGETEKNIMGILKSLAHDENKCVIVVTHSKKVSTYADELLTLNCGNLSF